MIDTAIAKLVAYGLQTGLVPPEDQIYVTNLILDVLKLDDYSEPTEEIGEVDLEGTLKELLDVDKDVWTAEAADIEEFYKKFDRLPDELKKQLTTLKENLQKYNKFITLPIEK